jgi:3-deoxy-D-manno-octulosonic-acid transferase
LRTVARSVAALSAIAAAPIAAGALALRPTWRVGLRERLGDVPRPAPGGLWVHAASVGEVLAATRLLDHLQKAGHALFASTVTLEGREVVRRLRPDIPSALAPLDHPWCVEAALDRVRPAAIALIETELWPVWIAAARRRGIPVVLVSGRVSDRSFPRYRRLGWLVGRTLRRLAAVGARTDVDGERFVALGADPARVSVTGDLKLERDEREGPLAPDLDAVLGGVPLFVAGSTHPGEEVAALAALRRIEGAGLQAALVLAPRRRQRGAEVARLVRASGRPLRQRTAVGGEPLRPGEVLVLDTVGELAPVYARAAVAFVGGSLVRGGGHNVLEPVLAGCPVLFGPHVANVRHAVEILERCGAGRTVEDAADLGRAAIGWLRDPIAARARGGEGRAVLRSHGGSAERAARLIESALAMRPAAAT